MTAKLMLRNHASQQQLQGSMKQLHVAQCNHASSALRSTSSTKPVLVSRLPNFTLSSQITSMMQARSYRS